jgi:hypothetical protein
LGGLAVKIVHEIVYRHDCGCEFQGSEYHARVVRDGNVVFHAIPLCAQTGSELREVERISIEAPDLP